MFEKVLHSRKEFVNAFPTPFFLIAMMDLAL